MRLLLIDEDPARAAALQQRLTAWQPEAELVRHSPRLQGTLAPEFLAQGYDAVLLTRASSGSGGLDWVKDLAGRSGFAPVVYLSEHADDGAARRAVELGAS